MVIASKENGQLQVFIKTTSTKDRKESWKKSNTSLKKLNGSNKHDATIDTEFRRLFGLYHTKQKEKARKKGKTGNDFIEYIKGNYDYTSLQHWRKIIRRNALKIPNIVLIDIAESKNKIKIGVTDPD